MDRLVVSVAIAVVLASAGSASSNSVPASVPETPDALIIQAKDHAELKEKWGNYLVDVPFCPCHIYG